MKHYALLMRMRVHHNSSFAFGKEPQPPGAPLMKKAATLNP